MSKKGIIILIVSIVSALIIIPFIVFALILILGLGTYTYNQANQSVMSAENISNQEILVFNSSFEPYEGNTLRAATIKSLIQTIQSSNSDNIGTNRIVNVTFDGMYYEEDDISQIISLLDSNSTYNVLTNKDLSGFINNIEISKN